MTKTQVLQEIRRMRFEEAYGGRQERRLTQEEAARLSLTALMEPPMFGFMEPLTGADLWSRTG